jgi:hypothetical protein
MHLYINIARNCLTKQTADHFRYDFVIKSVLVFANGRNRFPTKHSDLVTEFWREIGVTENAAAISTVFNSLCVSFLGVKRLGRGVEPLPPSNAEVKERLELYLCSSFGPT